jgi:hypothetical protein
MVSFWSSPLFALPFTLYSPRLSKDIHQNSLKSNSPRFFLPNFLFGQIILSKSFTAVTPLTHSPRSSPETATKHAFSKNSQATMSDAEKLSIMQNFEAFLVFNEQAFFQPLSFISPLHQNPTMHQKLNRSISRNENTCRVHQNPRRIKTGRSFVSRPNDFLSINTLSYVCYLPEPL